MLVLVWGLSGDTPVAAVREQLQLLEVPTVFVDQRLVLEMQVDLVVGHETNGWLRIGDQHVNLGEVTAVYQRPYLSTQVSTIANSGRDSAAWRHATQIDDVLAAWCDLTPAFVVNRSVHMCSNDSKPYQLRQIQRLGWSVPETLITTDPATAQAFWERHGQVIYKSISGVRSQVSRLKPEHLGRFTNICCCPTQFQKYIPGTDYRAHVVGSQVLGCEVTCNADDYRYSADDPAVVRACDLPAEIEDRCRRTAFEMHLPFVGIDLRRTPDGEWYCFEVNPSPGFTYYEKAAGQPIGRAVAELLVSDHAKVNVFDYHLADARVPNLAT